MPHRTLLVIGAVLLLACEKSPRVPETASVYTDDTIAHTLVGIELQAKPLIPAMRNQLRQLADQPEEQRRDNLTAHKNQLADLVMAMEADLQRVGRGDFGTFRALSDSVMDDLGGGTGNAEPVNAGELNRHIARVEHLIQLYDEAIRQSAGPVDR